MGDILGQTIAIPVHDCFIRSNSSRVFQIGKRGSTPQCDTTALNADSVSITHNVIISENRNEFIFLLQDVSHLEINNNTIIVDAIDSSLNGGFICLGGCYNNWDNRHPIAPVFIRNNIFANMGSPFLFNGKYAVYDIFHTIGSEVSMNYNLFYDINDRLVFPPDSGANSFVDNPLWVSYPSDLHLQPNSPGIDAGDPASPLDPDGTIADIGAFYFDQTLLIEGRRLPFNTSFELHRNYPNPFNPRTTIAFDLPHASLITLQVYDVTGKKVRTLLSRQLPAGHHQVVWDGTNDAGQPVASGVYFYRLNAGNFSAVRKMLLVR